MAEAMPYLKITIAASDGVGAEKPIGTGVTLQVPKQLSLKIARMYAAEVLGKELLKGTTLTDALKAIGCK